MRKKLTLMFVALIAVAAFAAKTVINALEGGKQEVIYALEVGDTFTSGQTVDVKNVDDGDVVATITYGEAGGAEFAAAKADGTAGEPWVASTAGNGTNGNKTGGTFYTIVPKYDGTIDIAVVLNADKAFYIEEDGTALEAYNGKTVTEKYYGTYQFEAKAGKSYKIYCAGSKLGFYGFKYVYTLEPKSLYIAGLSDVWDISNMTEIPYNKDTKTYVYEANIENPNVYFAISDVASSTDWGDFNGSHRYAIVKGQDYTPAIGEQVQLIKTEGEGAIGVPGKGKYKFTITEDMKMTITEMAPDKLYIIGDVNGWDNTALKEMTFNATTQTFEYTIETEGPSNFSISTVPSFNNWDEDFKGIYRYAIGEGNNTPQFGEEIQLTKCVEGNIYLDKAGKYLISVNKDMKITVKRYEDIVIDNPSGDLAAAIADAEKGKVAKDITINLTADAQYTLSAPIVAPANLTINGNGATIDASGNAGDVITLNGTTAFAKKADGTAPDHKLINKVEIKNIKILGLKGALITDAQKTLLENLTISNAVIEMPAAGKNVINFNGKGYVGNVKVEKSTIYANGKNTGFFAQYGSRPKNVNGDWLQAFDVQNSTFVNIANGKNFCDLKQNGTDKNVYTLKNNIFVDCGKNGQVVVGFNKGQNSATPVWDVDSNIFNWGGKDKSAAEVEKAGKKDDKDIVKNSVAGVVEFPDAAHGDFNGMFVPSEGAENPASMPGDPRWKLGVNAVAVDIKDIPENSDITEIIATKAGGHPISSIDITLAEDKNYMLTAPISASGDIVINGNGGTIDASNVDGALISYQAPAAAAPALNRAPATEAEGWTYMDNVTIKDVTITGIKGSIFYDNNVKLCVENFTIENAVLGLATEAVNNEAIIAFQGGGAKNFAVKNSTVYGNNAVAKYFLRYNNGSTIKAYGYSGNWNDDHTTFTYLNNTFYNLLKADGQWYNGRGIVNGSIYNVQKNIWYNCGYGDIVNRITTGRYGSGSSGTWLHNSYIDMNGATITQKIDTEALPYNSDFGPLFADPDNGDFTIGAGTPQAKAQAGDSRWLVPYDLAQAPEYTIDVFKYNGSGEIDVTVPDYYRAGDVYITLMNGEYKLKTPIKAGGGDFFYGYKGVIFVEGYDATIDASELEGPMIQIEGSVRNAQNANGSDNTNYKYLEYLQIDGLTIKGLKHSLVKDNQKTLVETLYVNDCNIDISGTENIFDFNGKGYPGYLYVNNSTLASENGHTGFFLQASGRVRDLDNTQETYRQYTVINNTTLYQIAKGKQMNNLQGKGQKSLVFGLFNTLLFDTGSATSNEVRGWLGGQNSTNPATYYDNNSYWADNTEATGWYDSSKQGSDQSGTQVYGKPFFRKLTNSTSWYTGDFTLGICAQIGKKVGDPRWYNIPMITNLENALAQAAALLFDAQRNWTLVDAENDRIAKLAAAHKENKPYMTSDNQEEVDAATARVLAAIAEFLGNDIASDPTAIESVNAAKTDNAAWYTINGQRVDRPTQKGLYIHNGRKVVIK